MKAWMRTGSIWLSMDGSSESDSFCVHSTPSLWVGHASMAHISDGNETGMRVSLDAMERAIEAARTT